MEFNKLGMFRSQAALSDVVCGVEYLYIGISLIMGAET